MLDLPGAESDPPAAPRRRPLLVAATVALGYLLLLSTRVEALLPGHHNWDKPWDHQKYFDMASNPLELRIAPFSWRLLGPFLARILPFDTTTSFRVLSFVAVWLTAVAVFVLLRRLRHDDVLAGVGMAIFLSLWWTAGYPLYNFWLPDVGVFLAVVVLAIAAIDRRPVLFAVVLVVGALAKEQVLIAAPLWYGLGTERLVDWRRFGQMLLLAAPALAVVLVVRALLPAANTDAAYLAQLGLELNAYDHLSPDPVTLFEKFGVRRVGSYPGLVSVWTFSAFGIFPLLGLAAWRRSGLMLLRWSPFLVLVYAQPLMASNTNRLIAVAFPVAILLAVDGLAAIRHRLGVPDAALLAAGASLLVLDLAAPRAIATVPVDAMALTGTIAVGVLVARVVGSRRRAVPSRLSDVGSPQP